MSEGNTLWDAVVIGSGFGGSIAALRLAEAGKSVLVLERGKRYNPGEFPRDVRDLNAMFWRYPRVFHSQGLHEFHPFSGIGVVTASGVGGGSLIYANNLVRPDAAIFNDPRWPDSIDRQRLEPYYDKVATMLGASPFPEEIKLAKRDAFRRAAQMIGRSVFDTDQGVNWSDPNIAGRQACQRVSECEFGCNYGAKNSTDLTYLAQAERLGTQVRPGSYVTSIETVADGYRVHLHDLGTGASTSVVGKRVVIAAGTIGTHKILFKCRDELKTLPKLSQCLGYGFSGNGDFLGSIQNSKVDLEPWKGPDVTSIIPYFDTQPGFTLAAPSFNRPVMEVLASLGQRETKLPGFIGARLWSKSDSLLYWALGKGMLSKPVKFHVPNAGDPGRMTNIFAIGQDNANGRIVPDHNGVDIEWNYADENSALVDKEEAAMREICGAYGGTFAPLITWSLFRRIITVHPMGGCRLAETPDKGVVSLHGEVHGYPGLFIADGSVIPTSIGSHPVMTISALAEYIAEAVVDSI